MLFVNFKFWCNKISKKSCIVNKSLEFRNEKLKNGEEQWEFFRQIVLNSTTDAHLVGFYKNIE